MGTQLSQVQQPAILPPRIVIHGGGGAGKSTFGASARDAILMPLEDGVGLLQIQALPQPDSYADVINAIGELASEEHSFKTLVIDTVDKLEPLIWQVICEEGGKPNIEAFGYGKGYTMCDELWVAFFKDLDELRRKGITPLVLCHNEGRVIDDPTHGSYHKWSPKLHKRANALLYEWADIVGFLEIERIVVHEDNERKSRATTTGQRVLFLEDTGGAVAKNRYDLPTRLMIPKDNPYEALRSEILKALNSVRAEKEAA